MFQVLLSTCKPPLNPTRRHSEYHTTLLGIIFVYIKHAANSPVVHIKDWPNFLPLEKPSHAVHYLHCSLGYQMTFLATLRSPTRCSTICSLPDPTRFYSISLLLSSYSIASQQCLCYSTRSLPAFLLTISYSINRKTPTRMSTNMGGFQHMVPY